MTQFNIYSLKAAKKKTFLVVLCYHIEKKVLKHSVDVDPRQVHPLKRYCMILYMKSELAYTL